MKYEADAETVAAPDRLWNALVDVEAWPAWMTSYTSVRRLEPGPLTVGSTARVEQPGLNAATYTVTELDPGSQFAWSSTAAGVRTTARHLVLTRSGERSAIHLQVEQRGPLAGLVAVFLGRKIRNFLQIEAAGLRRAAETEPGRLSAPSEG